jgi:hypothetical protein
VLQFITLKIIIFSAALSLLVLRIICVLTKPFTYAYGTFIQNNMYSNKNV